jgi:hypothetical protein
MEWLPEPKSSAVNARYWRDEILQLMCWLRGEGLEDRVDAAALTRFLGLPEQVGLRHLRRLVDDGLLTGDRAGRHRLTGEGRRHTARIFANRPADLTQPRYGECGRGCWCHLSTEEAAQCLAGRREPARVDRPRR